MINSKINIYVGTFLISAAALSLEIVLTRLLSVITWYHLAFFSVSAAMLGITAGAVTVYLKPDWSNRDNLNSFISKACIGYAISIPCTLLILCRIPIGTGLSITNILILLVITVACALPFYFSGIAITAVLTKFQLSIGKLYASDLAGAAIGCLLVLGGLELFDAATLILITGTLAILAAFSFSINIQYKNIKQLISIVLILFIILIPLNSLTNYGIQPVYVKDNIDDYSQHLLEKWNSYSRVVVYNMSESSPFYWGASPFSPKDIKIPQYRMNIDGSAATYLSKFTSLSDIEYLRYDITNVVHYLQPEGTVCIIGAGGGRDIQSAILFKHENIVAIEMNPVFIDLLENEFRYFAGVADYPGVTLINDEARSYLSRTNEKYSLIQMSLVDTWAATGAGAFSLSENGLYTSDAWKIFINCLTEDGIFTVTRWYNSNNPIETGRLLSLATASLIESGISNPSQHIIMVNSGSLASLMISKQPFSQDVLTVLKNVTSELGFQITIIPGTVPDNYILAKIVSAESSSELISAVSGEPYNLKPPTDENPYFFNILKLNELDVVDLSQQGVLSGNLSATLTLLGLIICLILACAATIVFPLLLKVRNSAKNGEQIKILWPAAIYFSLIGAGFMFTEIALVQRLSVFLGHPIYALGILLFTLIASSAIGSLMSDRLPLTRKPWLFVYPGIIALAIILIRFILPILGTALLSTPMLYKILVSIIIIMPLGFIMGVAFPTGMRLISGNNTSETPWYWALNGIWGVLSSALAVLISIYISISTSLYVGATCYILLIPCIVYMYKKISGNSLNKRQEIKNPLPICSEGDSNTLSAV